jgi:hypothetical protein
MSMKQCWVDDDRDPKTKNVEVDEFKSCSCKDLIELREALEARQLRHYKHALIKWRIMLYDCSREIKT